MQIFEVLFYELVFENVFQVFKSSESTCRLYLSVAATNAM